MTRALLRLRGLAFFYLKWGWPILLADALLASFAGEPSSAWRRVVNTAAFGWILCAPIAPLSLLLDRALRERAMSRLCGLRESDERERAISGEAARTTLLLSIALQSILLAMTLVHGTLDYDPSLPEGRPRGLIQVGLSFDSSRHLNPFSPSDDAQNRSRLLPPQLFSILGALLFLELASFKALTRRRYEGLEP